MWSIVFSRRSIWGLLELIRRWTNTFPRSTGRKVKLNKFAFRTPWLPDLLCKHWFTSSVWNFCRWVADVPPRETSLSGDEREETSAVRRLKKELSAVKSQMAAKDSAVVDDVTIIMIEVQITHNNILPGSLFPSSSIRLKWNSLKSFIAEKRGNVKISTGFKP